MKNEIISITLPVTIEGHTSKNVTYSYSNLKNEHSIKGEVEETLRMFTKIIGIRSILERSKFKLDIQVDHEEKTAKTFYIRSDDELVEDDILDDELLEHSLSIAKEIVEVVDTLNKEFTETSNTFTYELSPELSKEFEITSDVILYKHREAPSLINNLLNLLKKQPHGIVLSSKGMDIPFVKQDSIAPSLKVKAAKNNNKIEVIGNIASIQYYPYKKIKMVDTRVKDHFIQSFDITKDCYNFDKLQRIGGSSLIKLSLIKSSRTEQYNIAKIDVLDEPMNINEVLPSINV